MAQKPSLPKGTRDILPDSMLQREYILDCIRSVFKKYGFAPIETPAMEKLSTLTGKYGEEGDRLIFKILPRGRKYDSAFKESDSTAVEKRLSENIEEALRYDLTVPFARFVAQNQNDLSFPFKRYQIQPVWRADRPQKGRFREFFQCDADAIGSKSLLQELEFISIYQEVFQNLQLPVRIKMNHRKVLAGLTENFGVYEHFGAFTIALDKLDKIGLEGVVKELSDKGLADSATDALKGIANLSGTNNEKLESLISLVGESEIGKEGLDELKFVLHSADTLGISDLLDIDLSLARGLDYYTGAIFEVKAEGIELGSIGGGGRYDDLTGIFGLPNMPGIGISFGLDRIQLALEELTLFPSLAANSTEILLINFGDEEALFGLKLAKQLRDLGVKVESYPDSTKLKKQLDYANKKGIHYVLMIGSNEIKEGKFLLKDMRDGSQEHLGAIELLEKFNPQKSSHHGH